MSNSGYKAPILYSVDIDLTILSNFCLISKKVETILMIVFSGRYS